jgi:hypothetical protein
MMRMPAYDGKAVPVEAKEKPRGIGPAEKRRLALAGVGLALVALLVAGMFALLRPLMARRQAIAEVRRYALAERRIEDPGSGLVIELPAGWMALRNDNPYVVRPGARLALAQPAKGVFGAVSLAVRPAMMDDPDRTSPAAAAAAVRQPSQREVARGSRSSPGRGRLVRTTWDDDRVPMQAPPSRGRTATTPSRRGPGGRAAGDAFATIRRSAKGAARGDWPRGWRPSSAWWWCRNFPGTRCVSW